MKAITPSCCRTPDRRIVFAIPYEKHYTLVGTTDEPWSGLPGKAHISPEETDYLCETVRSYFARQIQPQDVVWSYAGIRPLYDDHAASASAVTRDYVLDLDGGNGAAPLLSVFGGKITTYRKLAEHAMEKLVPFYPGAKGDWTAGADLPGGDIPSDDFDAFVARLATAHPGIPFPLLTRLARAYGTRVKAILGTAQSMDALGTDFGGGLTKAEVDYLATQEWARTAEDVLYRRSKLGLHVPPGTAEAVEAYLAARNP